VTRILITGSRDWTDRTAIKEALADACGDLGRVPWDEGVTLISGACLTGADALAESIWWDEWGGADLERFPANWERHGKRAGYIRNQAMVNAGADICLAFIKNNSRGATMTADLAEKAGIRTIRYTAQSVANAHLEGTE